MARQSTPSVTADAGSRGSRSRPGTAAHPVRPLRRLIGITSATLVLALTAACSQEAPAAPTPPPDVTVTPTVEPSRTVPPEPVVPVVWPLTGVEVAEPVDRPAVAVKVENTAIARPQSGLESADVVWETVVEFEVSRFIAVYHSQLPEEVGPIRSVRPVDVWVVEPLGGLLAFSGGQRGILAEVNASGTQALSHDAGNAGMYRVRSRSAPHNVYGSAADFVARADGSHTASPPEQFAFAPRADLATAVVSGDPISGLGFRLSAQARPSWAWDAGSSTWLRSEGGTPAKAASGARLSATNVVSITAPHPGTRYRAQGGASVPTYLLVGSGPALIATGGKVVQATWRKDAMDAPMQLVTADGEPALLAPGNTWVELVPEGKGSISTS